MTKDLFEAPDYLNLDDLLSEEHKLVRDTTRNWGGKNWVPINSALPSCGWICVSLR